MSECCGLLGLIPLSEFLDNEGDILNPALVHIFGVILTAIVAFAAANIGDLLVLLLFFADRRFRSWQIVTGQYLGVSAVIALCLLGAGVATRLPALLVRGLGIVPIAVGIHKLVARRAGAEAADIRQGRSHSANVLTVAAISFADCSDNLAVFTPLFTRSNRVEQAIATLTFLVLIGVWCGSARYFTRHPKLGERFRAIGNNAAPWGLIGLGIFILLW